VALPGEGREALHYFIQQDVTQSTARRKGADFGLLSEAFTPEQWAELLETVLECAVAKGDRGLAWKLVVGAGVKIGLALHKAIRGGHRELVDDLLLEMTEDPWSTITASDDNGYTPVHLAVLHDHPGI